MTDTFRCEAEIQTEHGEMLVEVGYAIRESHEDYGGGVRRFYSQVEIWDIRLGEGHEKATILDVINDYWNDLKSQCWDHYTRQHDQ